MKEDIEKILKELEDKGVTYIFENREDFVDTRTDWNSLADIAEQLHEALEQIKTVITKR